MDTETASVMRYLEAVADVAAGLHALAGRLWCCPGVKPWATPIHYAPQRERWHHWDEGRQREVISTALYVSAELMDTTYIDWSLEISCDGSEWLVERAVYRRDPDEDSSHTAIAFPDWRGTSFEELIDFLPVAVKSLAETLNDPALLELRLPPASIA